MQDEIIVKRVDNIAELRRETEKFGTFIKSDLVIETQQFPLPVTIVAVYFNYKFGNLNLVGVAMSATVNKTDGMFVVAKDFRMFDNLEDARDEFKFWSSAFLDMLKNIFNVFDISPKEKLLLQEGNNEKTS